MSGSSPNLQAWVGRQEVEQDIAALAPLKGLEALMDHDLSLGTGIVPFLGHWLYFLPKAFQSTLDEDGHPHRGGFLPPVLLPRRMWASGKVHFHTPIAIGNIIERRSTIASVEEKSGQTGALVIITVIHSISSEGRLCIEEEQNIVYREPPPPSIGQHSSTTALSDRRASDRTQQISPNASLLFRYSALTFNAHRIHYDRDYTRDVEGYPTLVVHGPLSATLLMDHFLRQYKGVPVSFEFRARKPLFDDAPFDLCCAQVPDGFDLWTSGPDGAPAMTAHIKTA